MKKHFLQGAKCIYTGPEFDVPTEVTIEFVQKNENWFCCSAANSEPFFAKEEELKLIDIQ